MARILIVDDESTPRVLLGKHFIDAGHTVGFAGNGWEALLAMKERFDLVLCDLKMPGMGGATYVTIMREEHGKNAPPVVILTGPGDDAGELVGLDVQAVMLKGQGQLSEILKTANALLKPAGQ